MAHDTARGLHVWDLLTDQFDHTELAQNWDKLETLISAGTQSIETLTTVPVSGNFAGRLVMLSAGNGGFPAWSTIRYDGSQWRVVGPIEILPALPVLGNYAGRIVILSAADGAFAAWEIVRYNGVSWGSVGAWTTISTGGGALNINGTQTTGDMYVNSGTKGVVLKDRTTGLTWRIYIDHGVVSQEQVS